MGMANFKTWAISFANLVMDPLANAAHTFESRVYVGFLENFYIGFLIYRFCDLVWKQIRTIKTNFVKSTKKISSAKFRDNSFNCL